MTRIEEKLLFYHTLGPDERAEVDAYVEGNPELESMLEEMSRLGTLFESARGMMKEPIQDDALVYYVVTRCYSRYEVPELLQEVFERVDARIASDPALRARYERFVERLHMLEEESDPAEQFERLAGFPVGAAERHQREDRNPVQRGQSTTVRSLVQILPPSVRWAAAVAITVIAVYGLLYAFSMAVTPQHERLAALDNEELQIEGFEVRGRGESFDDGEESIDVLYLETLALLRDARTSTLGLFPRYDQRVLETAEMQLEEVVNHAEPGSFIQLDALYFLGKVRLGQGEVEAAQEALQQVVQGEGRMSDEAYNILVHLEENRA